MIAYLDCGQCHWNPDEHVIYVWVACREHRDLLVPRYCHRETKNMVEAFGRPACWFRDHQRVAQLFSQIHQTS